MDETIKKKVLQMLPSPVCVIGCSDGQGNVHAFGGSWLGQCSMTPPVLWIAVKSASRPEQFLDRGGAFSVSLLRPEAKKMVGTFFKTPDPADGKFGDIPYTLGPLGSPVLEDCLGWVECRVIAKVTPGDHALYYGEAIECCLNAEGPILTTVTSGWKYGG